MGRGASGEFDSLDIQRTGITIDPEVAKATKKKGRPRKKEVCEIGGHEWMSENQDKPDALDRVSALVTITHPPAAAKVNKPERACASCAGKLAKGYLGFGWFVHVDPL
jgi:hypothetical protein